MDVGGQVLLLDDFAAQRGEDVAFGGGESGAKIGFVLGGDPGKFIEHAAAGFGEGEFGVTAIFLAALALD